MTQNINPFQIILHYVLILIQYGNVEMLYNLMLIRSFIGFLIQETQLICMYNTGLDYY